jgi:hypothetical protein
MISLRIDCDAEKESNYILGDERQLVLLVRYTCDT